MDIPQITSEAGSVTGDMGQIYLATGKQVALRCWREHVGDFCDERSRDYETVGYVLSGVLDLDLEGQVAQLKAGDSWLVPEHAKHRYRIVEPLVAIEATSPPARFGDKDHVIED
jgi:quercetin dioxygenase-like cupin family protein